MALNDKRFIWDTNVDGTGSETEFNAKTIAMGDGYQQDISIGINTSKEKWNWSLVTDKETAETIRDFLKGCKGSESFMWESPFGDLRVKSSGFQSKPLGGPWWQLSGTFNQRYR